MRMNIGLDFLGEGISDAVFVQWRRQAGDKVMKGDIICEVETYKVLLPIEAPENGVLTDLQYAPGDTVAVPAVLGYIETGE